MRTGDTPDRREQSDVVLSEFEEKRLTRLRRSIRQAAEASSGLDHASGGEALADAYARFRDVTRQIVPEEHLPEFEAVCPELTKPKGLARPEVGRKLFSEAEILLGSLAGFLDGYADGEEKTRLRRDGRAGIYL